MLLRDVEKVAAAHFAMNVVVKYLQQLLRKIGRFFRSIRLSPPRLVEFGKSKAAAGYPTSAGEAHLQIKGTQRLHGRPEERRHDAAYDFDDLLAAIDAELAQPETPD